jgi:membrane associated rhomboid family serine protease
MGVIVATFLLEHLVLATWGVGAFETIFLIKSTPEDPFLWAKQPWTLVTSVFAHAPAQISHILFNTLILLFFGATVERLIGTRRFTMLFLGAGVIAGIAQVALMSALGQDSAALGASGALQGLMGALVILAPTLTVLVFFIIPAPLWALVILYVLLDIVGFITPDSPVANVAHLAGLAVGIAYGYHLRKKGLRVRVQPTPPMGRQF